jgi:hypothetical protein
MEENPKLNTILLYTSMIIACISMLINLLLLIPIIKVPNSYLHRKFLSIQFLISFIVVSVYIIIFSQNNLNAVMPCKVLEILRIWGSCLVFNSSFSILFISFLEIRRSSFAKKPKCLIIFSILCTWLPPLIITLLFILRQIQFHPEGDNPCSYSEFKFFPKVFLLYIICVYIVSAIICFIIIISVRNFEGNVNEQSKKIKRKAIRMIVSYIVAILIFQIFMIMSFDVKVPHIVQYICRPLFSLFIFYMLYVFVWNDEVHIHCKAFYLCKSVNMDTTITNDSFFTEETNQEMEMHY